MWFEKMMRIVSRGLSNIEELEKVKTEETVRGEGSQVLIENSTGIRSVEGVHILWVPRGPPNSLCLPTSLCLRDFLPILDFLNFWEFFKTLEKLILLVMLERFTTSSQVFNWFLDIFAGIISFPSDKVLFVSSFSSFIDDGLDFVFLVWGYLNPSFLKLY